MSAPRKFGSGPYCVFVQTEGSRARPGLQSVSCFKDRASWKRECKKSWTIAEEIGAFIECRDHGKPANGAGLSGRRRKG